MLLLARTLLFTQILKTWWVGFPPVFPLHPVVKGVRMRCILFICAFLSTCFHSVEEVPFKRPIRWFNPKRGSCLGSFFALCSSLSSSSSPGYGALTIVAPSTHDLGTPKVSSLATPSGRTFTAVSSSPIVFCLTLLLGSQTISNPIGIHCHRTSGSVRLELTQAGVTSDRLTVLQLRWLRRIPQNGENQKHGDLGGPTGLLTPTDSFRSDHGTPFPTAPLPRSRLPRRKLGGLAAMTAASFTERTWEMGAAAPEAGPGGSTKKVLQRSGVESQSVWITGTLHVHG